MPAGQSAARAQPQVRVAATQAAPLVPAAQSAHRPLAPQLALAVPGLHFPSLPQHASLQACVSEQASVHACVLRSHAVPVGQSVVALHPQAPPLDCALHCVPFGLLAQSAQSAPLPPQALIVKPATQRLVAPSQHPWLQGWLAEQLAVHSCRLASHANPTAQSALLLQPQTRVPATQR